MTFEVHIGHEIYLQQITLFDTLGIVTSIVKIRIASVTYKHAVFSTFTDRDRANKYRENRIVIRAYQVHQKYIFRIILRIT